MRPSSQVEVKCWLCPLSFKNRKQLKNHMTAEPHRRMSVVCVWCPEETFFRRQQDLKQHILQDHRSKFEMMPYNFLTENNGFWFAHYPESYARLVKPSLEGSEEAMKARLEVLSFLKRAKTIRTEGQWKTGWACHRTLVGEEDSDDRGTKRGYSPSRPEIFDDLQLEAVSIGAGVTKALFSLDYELSVSHFEVHISDRVMREPRMMEPLVRRMTALAGRASGIPVHFPHQVTGIEERKIRTICAKKLLIQEELIGKINSTDEITQRPIKLRRAVVPLSPLKTPSTSNIQLEPPENTKQDQRIVKERKTEGKTIKGMTEGKGKKEDIKGKDKDKKKDKDDKEKTRDKDSRRKEDVKETKDANKEHHKTHKVEEKRTIEEGKEERAVETKHQKAQGEDDSIRRKENVVAETKHHQERTQEVEETSKKNEIKGNEAVEDDHKEKTQRVDEETRRENEENMPMDKEQHGIVQEVEGSRGKDQVEGETAEKEHRGQINEPGVEVGKVDVEKKEMKRQEITHGLRREAEEDTNNEGAGMEVDERGDRNSKEHNRSAQKFFATPCVKSPEERAHHLLSLGGMPLFPSARREWQEEEIITLVDAPTTIKWPPRRWREMKTEEKLFKWEMASMALELKSGRPMTYSSREEMLTNYNFLALQGTTNMINKGNHLVLAQYNLYQTLKDIIKERKSDQQSTSLLTVLEQCVASRSTPSNELCSKLNELGIPLRLWDDSMTE